MKESIKALAINGKRNIIMILKRVDVNHSHMVDALVAEIVSIVSLNANRFAIDANRHSTRLNHTMTQVFFCFD